MDQCEKQEKRLNCFSERFLTEDSLLWSNTKKLPREEPQQKERIEKQAAAKVSPRLTVTVPWEIFISRF